MIIMETVEDYLMCGDWNRCGMDASWPETKRDILKTMKIQVAIFLLVTPCCDNVVKIRTFRRSTLPPPSH